MATGSQLGNVTVTQAFCYLPLRVLSCRHFESQGDPWGKSWIPAVVCEKANIKYYVVSFTQSAPFKMKRKMSIESDEFYQDTDSDLFFFKFQSVSILAIRSNMQITEASFSAVT